MDLLLFLTGFLLLVVVTADFLFTTIGAQERTLLSLRITQAIFRSLRRTTHADRSPWVHMVSGPLVMTGLAGLWILGVTVGWALIFAAWPGSIEAVGNRPAPGWWDIFAHVGYMLSTLGAATTLPAGTLWYVMGGIVAVNGMVILTLAVSFTLSTTQTVARGRAFAALAALMEPGDARSFPILAPGLTEVCSGLKSAPYALFYSTWDRDLRLPGALVRFAEAAAQGDRFTDYCRILRMLPGFDPDEGAAEDEFLALMRDWSAGYSLAG
jgi:hypothetical protein